MRLLVVACVLAVLFGCSAKDSPLLPGQKRAQPSGVSYCLEVDTECAVAQFRGFPEFDDYDVILIQSDPADTNIQREAPYQDENLSTPDGIVHISPYGLAFTYQFPTSLFASGKYPSFLSDRLCADINYPYGGGPESFPNLGPRSYIWHGDSINVQPEDRNVVVRHKGWTVIFNEVIDAPGAIEINVAHFLGPGRREVKLSHVRQVCRP